jgi:hypothetical protein
MLTTILLWIALACFIAEAVHWPKAPFSFGWIGLALWILTLLIK